MLSGFGLVPVGDICVLLCLFWSVLVGPVVRVGNYSPFLVIRPSKWRLDWSILHRDLLVNAALV